MAMFISKDINIEDLKNIIIKEGLIDYYTKKKFVKLFKLCYDYRCDIRQHSSIFRGSDNDDLVIRLRFYYEKDGSERLLTFPIPYYISCVRKNKIEKLLIENLDN